MIQFSSLMFWYTYLNNLFSNLFLMLLFKVVGALLLKFQVLVLCCLGWMSASGFLVFAYALVQSTVFKTPHLFQLSSADSFLSLQYILQNVGFLFYYLMVRLYLLASVLNLNILNHCDWQNLSAGCILIFTASLLLFMKASAIFFIFWAWSQVLFFYQKSWK